MFYLKVFENENSNVLNSRIISGVPQLFNLTNSTSLVGNINYAYGTGSYAPLLNTTYPIATESFNYSFSVSNCSFYLPDRFRLGRPSLLYQVDVDFPWSLKEKRKEFSFPNSVENELKSSFFLSKKTLKKFLLCMK